ncbi:hypothetical protein C5B42_05335 [Candidatus Cerribacteria bacterium 'Amazon FNV 2010 28 9']|uniref:Uncharacterized protein n=1 Tax=Candidatus Cerribacteria bacterium 'Amazon FNV 2010 28 9' TaxID=2081795 RepID=A0A317JM75_9BACT|nr:MAG: hypothetical protein C5B42_05335 [Candidatus Cerribacteria bacterium 'Amazon FNV 2010 28 9']
MDKGNVTMRPQESFVPPEQRNEYRDLRHIRSTLLRSVEVGDAFHTDTIEFNKKIVAKYGATRTDYLLYYLFVGSTPDSDLDIGLAYPTHWDFPDSSYSIAQWLRAEERKYAR